MRRRGRWLIGAAVFVAAALSLSAPGFASCIGWSSRTLGGNRVTVSKCDSDGFDVIQNLTGANVTSVTVSGIASGCAGGLLSVAVDNATNSSSGTAAVPAGGGTVTVTLAVAVPAKDAEEIDAAISGP